MQYIFYDEYKCVWEGINFYFVISEQQTDYGEATAR